MMKRYLAGFLVVLFLGTFSRAQNSKAPFDVKKSQEELEIMKGIISTRLSYASQDSQRENQSLWRFSNINAFYLSGQGAVFIIPTSNISPSSFQYSYDELGRLSQQIELSRIQNAYLARAEATFAEANSKLSQWKGSGSGQGTGGPQVSISPAPPAPPSPPAPAAAPAPPSPPAPASPPPQPFITQANQEDLRKNEVERVFELQEKAKKRAEEEKANREKFLNLLAGIKDSLSETLANYGDSLTAVRPNEYINLALMTEGFDSEGSHGFNSRKTRYDIISVQKSWITEYKAGRLSLDSFKQKVIQYTE